MHACICAAYRIYGGVDYLLTEIGAKRHEIKLVCNQFEKDFDRFLVFWAREGYQTSDGRLDMNKETEALYLNVMRWAQLPLSWSLGDPQHVEDAVDVVIKIEIGDRVLKFHRTVEKSEMLSDVEESWCVSRVDTQTLQQVVVEDGLDRGLAQMIAKRMSAEDADRVYTATKIETITERRIEACPIKAYIGGQTVGDVRKVFKKK
jgi:hypothetical protein